MHYERLLTAANSLAKTASEDDDILRHISNGLNELVADIDFLVENGGVPREKILHLVMRHLAGKKEAEKPKTGKDAFLAALEGVPNNTPVFPAQLRKRLPSMSKEEFDRVAMELYRSGDIVLMHHDMPHNVPEAEKNSMIRDGNTYYNVISVRR